MVKGNNKREIIKVLVPEPEHKPDRLGGTGGSIAAGERGAKRSKEPISLGNLRASPLESPVSRLLVTGRCIGQPHGLPKSKYEGRGGCKAKEIKEASMINIQQGTRAAKGAKPEMVRSWSRRQGGTPGV